MGRPFIKELSEIWQSYQWSASVDLNFSRSDLEKIISFPTLAVASGGSLSACSYLSLLHQSYGSICKVITPLELYYSKKLIRNSNVVFLSASGKNSDILFGFNLAIQYEARNILSICMKKGSRLAKESSKYSIAQVIDFNHPSGKDGFLATNSLVSFFVILSRIYDQFRPVQDTSLNNSFYNFISSFSKSLNEEFTIQVLYGGWATPVAIDIESKFTEAGLGNVLLADFRNFAHGRHNWFDKKKKQSAIVALITPSEKDLALKTLSLLPKTIPRLTIETDDNTAAGSVELLIKSFHLVNTIGKLKGIDPGRPGVPDYGSKLYNLKYFSLYKKRSDETNKHNLAILRKINSSGIISLRNEEYDFWLNSYKQFLNKVNSSKFTGIVFDYDGTLCSSEERYDGPSEKVKQELLRLIQANIIIGIVTGRGKSARIDFQKFIPKKYWKNIVMGYYNGSQISYLDNNKLPDSSFPKDNSLEQLLHQLKSHSFISKLITEKKLVIDPRPKQLTVEIKEIEIGNLIKDVLLDLVAKFDFKDIKVLQSSHSIDIILNSVSKLDILKECGDLAKKNNKNTKFLCIGDCGKWPGNDYQLLSSEFSLSVDQVSADPDTCWNLASHGIKNIDATVEYLQAIDVDKYFFKIKL
jgi:hydroxymethylpyrimidine pyrophosphatase-like HAD family hydrolase